ncbi:MAG: hypothetical protein KIS61_00320 [Candidatus Eremiobacteraeota bacterium]|jgi:flagellar basal body rod protein FlgB|nr:hypothetical protein [Candidatus Eremiobacteraeota bacterium]
MLDSFFNSGVVASSKLAMEASWRSYAEASHNLSNADTPGYRPTYTDFKSVLLEKQSAEMPPKGEVFQAYLQDLKPQSEEVSLERELSRLSQASMDADALTKILNQQYSGLRSAIYEGKR